MYSCRQFLTRRPLNKPTAISDNLILAQSNFTSRYQKNDDQLPPISKPRLFSTAHDVRLAGRKRFYKVVNVCPIQPPWENDDVKNGKRSNSEDNLGSPIDSPISAGVDNSPSGVLKTNSSKTSLETLKHQLLSLNNVSSYSDPFSIDWYTITLDNRPLRTPLGNPMTIPSLPLSLAIAAEWDAQTEYLVPTQMPLMTLTCTTLDQVSTHSAFTETQNNCMKYLFNDTTCYYADPSEDRVLYRKQVKYWETIHDFVENKLLFGENNSENNLGKMRPAVAHGHFDGMLLSRGKGTKNSGLPHPPELVQAIQTYVQSLNAWELTCLQTITMEAKSLLLGLSILKSVQNKNNGSKSASKCFDGKVHDFVMAARVEEEFQIENWGLVEGGHDYDRLNCSVQITAATFMLEAIRNNTN